MSFLAAAEVGGVDESRARRVDLRDGGVAVGEAAAEGGLDGVEGREIGRAGLSRDVCAACGIDRDAEAGVKPAFGAGAAAEVGGVDERVARRV